MAIPTGSYELSFTTQDGYYLEKIASGDDLIIYNPFSEIKAANRYLSNLEQSFTEFKIPFFGKNQ